MSDRRVSCSKNVDDILLSARASAAARGGDAVTEVDLLRGFVRVGGGRLGKWLRARGVVLEALTTTLFLDDSELNWARFDDYAQSILRAALDCAKHKGHEGISRIHLLYGLLRVAESPLRRRVLNQGIDADRLADLLFVSLKSGTAVSVFVQGHASEFSAGLVKCLCVAELDASSSGDDTLVSAQHLFAALLKDGGGEAGKFLVGQGVRLTDLLR